MEKGNYTAFAAAAVCFACLVLIYNTPSVGIAAQWISAIFVLAIAGIMIQKYARLNGGYGLYLLGGKKGISTIDGLAKDKSNFWDNMSIWGLVMGFGLSSYALMKGKLDKRLLLFGIISLFVFELVLMPFISYGMQFVNLPGFNLAGSGTPNIGLVITPYSIAILIALFAFGFSGIIFFAILLNSASIIYSSALFASNPTSAGLAASGLSQQIPGVAPVLPGITIPLFAGIISFAILLIVHEFSHGVLARRAKIKIKSVGVVLFGIVPIGGFVEPDEKAVLKLNGLGQTKIFTAGISANLIAAVIFTCLLFIFIFYIAPSAYHNGLVISSTDKGYPAYNIIKPGTQIISWNGKNVSSIDSLYNATASDVSGKTISIGTPEKTYLLTAIADPQNSSRGVVGVNVVEKPIINNIYASVIYFLVKLFALSALLNFLVAVVNLLPIPGLDGWRVYMANIKSRRFVNFLGALIIILLIVNIVPWIFYI